MCNISNQNQLPFSLQKKKKIIFFILFLVAKLKRAITANNSIEQIHNTINKICTQFKQLNKMIIQIKY